MGFLSNRPSMPKLDTGNMVKHRRRQRKSKNSIVSKKHTSRRPVFINFYETTRAAQYYRVLMQSEQV
jgi:hypothetical protein